MKTLFIIPVIFSMLFSPLQTINANSIMKEDKAHINKWNNFFDELYQLHLGITKKTDIRTEETLGGYGGTFANNEFYREISYFNKNTNILISKIQWEIDNPKIIHAIEVYLYDNKGRVKMDFYARYLPEARNAPIQTLINLHHYSDNLHAFRQFDANGELIYETCRGKFFNETINLHLSDEEIVDFKTDNTDEMLSEAYSECFFNVSTDAGDYLHPERFIKNETRIDQTDLSIEDKIVSLDQKINQDIKNPLLYIQRGDILFKLHQFEQAINDYNKALSIDSSLQQAYFGRGMALARNGQINEGINDLTTYIKHNPYNSLAYTKRGVRYIWAGKLDLAKNDLLKAVELNNKNSEAHDDLGVLYAQNKDYNKAEKHFTLAIQYDPSYQKAYHNLSMIYLIKNSPAHALTMINKSLALDSDSRNSLILKSEILRALGKEKEADTIRNKAEFLPEGNWSERLLVK